jgi:hypothetical protein
MLTLIVDKIIFETENSDLIEKAESENENQIKNLRIVICRKLEPDNKSRIRTREAYQGMAFYLRRS